MIRKKLKLKGMKLYDRLLLQTKDQELKESLSNIPIIDASIVVENSWRNTEEESTLEKEIHSVLPLYDRFWVEFKVPTFVPDHKRKELYRTGDVGYDRFGGLVQFFDITDKDELVPEFVGLYYGGQSEEVKARVKYMGTFLLWLGMTEGYEVQYEPLMAHAVGLDAAGDYVSFYLKNGVPDPGYFPASDFGEAMMKHNQGLDWASFVTFNVLPAWEAVSLMGASNVELVHKHASRVSQMLSRSTVPLVSHYELKVKKTKKRVVYDNKPEPTGKRRRLHPVIGHRKYFTAERPFFGRSIPGMNPGEKKFWWWPAFVRGDARLGIITRDYKLVNF